MSGELPAPTPAQLATADRNHAITKHAVDELVAAAAGQAGGDPTKTWVEFAWGTCTEVVYGMSRREAAHVAAVALISEAVLRLGEQRKRIAELHSPVVLRKGSGADYYVTATVCRSCAGASGDVWFDEDTLVPGRPAKYPCATLRAVGLPDVGVEGREGS